MSDPYLSIEQCVESAVASEQRRGNFRHIMQRTLASLHRSIRLPEQDAPLHLTCFVIRYVQAVPQWLRQLETLCESAGLNLVPVRDLLTKNFVEVPERQPHEKGLSAILNEAYIAHRTMEEINDILQGECGTPLLPMDPLVANLVVRELLGESLACQLDHLCDVLVKRFEQINLDPEKLVSMILCKQKLNETPGDWPDFARQLQIELRPPSFNRQTDATH